MTDNPQADEEFKPRKVSVLGREFVMPQSRMARIAIGAVLVVLGCFGFLPVLGFWMIPLGLLILSYEFATVRRWRRRSSVWWATRKGRRRER
jgi:apolipoprotein N-acyltransferase